MKKQLILALCVMTVFLLPFSFHGQEKPDEELTKRSKLQKLSSSKDGITLTMKEEQYTTFSNSIVLQIQNSTNKEFSYREHFLLEKNIDGTWYEVPCKSYYLTKRSKVLHPHASSRIILFTDELEYDLTPGKYRATDSFSPNGHEKEGFTLAVPFKVIKQENS